MPPDEARIERIARGPKNYADHQQLNDQRIAAPLEDLHEKSHLLLRPEIVRAVLLLPRLHV